VTGGARSRAAAQGPGAAVDSAGRGRRRPAAGDGNLAGLGLVGPPTSALRELETGGSSRSILRVFPAFSYF
jgi:hypothetical protein